ncbi:unnamed protein product, partial [Ectocarpus sp. 8 AP-2014]
VSSPQRGVATAPFLAEAPSVVPALQALLGPALLLFAPVVAVPCYCFFRHRSTCRVPPCFWPCALSVACCSAVGCGETCSPSGHAAHLRLRLLLFRLAAARVAATTAVPGHLPHFVIVTHARFV